MPDIRIAAPRLGAALAATLTAAGCAVAAENFTIEGGEGAAFAAQTVASFDNPWAMTFLPDGRMLVTTRPGKLFIVGEKVAEDGVLQEVEGVWNVVYGGQGGLGDVVLHPDYENNGWIYFSHAEAGEGGYGAVVTRARLDENAATPRLVGWDKVWRQEPKTSGRGHYSHRIAFDADGMMFITSGDRQKQDPAQDFDSALGKIIRLKDDGAVPEDNPWQDRGELARTFWSVGHRNMLGMDFDAEGRLWVHEMGPRHGDELNLIVAGDNYGWPERSMGDNYSGLPIADHEPGDGFNQPEAYWVPAISPSGFVIYQGEMFPDWRGDGFIGGLSSRSLVRIAFDGETAREAERFQWGKRVREVEEGPDGALWLLEDRRGGRLLKLTPPPES